MFQSTPLQDAYLITPKRFEDERGFFMVSCNHDDYKKAGLEADFIQTNISYNHHKGTMRGLHSRIEGHQEIKLVRCTRGAVYDVIIDTRRNSPTHNQWYGAELTAENRHMMYVPKGFLHGYLTLTDDCEVEYHVTEAYNPDAETGARYNDPLFSISWPIPITHVAERDTQWADWTNNIAPTNTQ